LPQKGRSYLDFCQKHGHPPGAATSLAPFLTKLAAKNQSVAQRSQAYASHLLLANYDLQTIQRLLRHSDIKTTMIYLQTVPSVTVKEAKKPAGLLVRIAAEPLCTTAGGPYLSPG
jgi:hypothetical protein